jgi:hypothetical protein
MRGYFSKSKGAREQKSLENISLVDCFDGLENMQELIVLLSAIILRCVIPVVFLLICGGKYLYCNDRQ